VTTTERLQWLKERQSGLGSSDAPNLVGLGYRTAQDVYFDKTEPVNDKPAQGNLRRGLELEPLVAQMYKETMGVDVAMPECAQDRIKRHPERPWQICTPDACRTDDGTPVQFKTTAGFGDDWGPTGSDQVPDYIRIERQHEMGVLGVEQMDLISLDVIAWEPRVYRLMFERSVFDWLTTVEAEFWLNVLARQPVGLEWEIEHAPPLPAIRDQGVVDLGDGVAALIGQRRKCQDIAKEAEAEGDRIKAQIEAAMGESERAVAGGWKLKRTLIAGSTYTATRKAYVRLDCRKNKEQS
jgi:putative phage-type endonuclease